MLENWTSRKPPYEPTRVSHKFTAAPLDNLERTREQIRLADEAETRILSEYLDKIRSKGL